MCSILGATNFHGPFSVLDASNDVVLDNQDTPCKEKSSCTLHSAWPELGRATVQTAESSGDS